MSHTGVHNEGGPSMSDSDTLAPNQYATYDEWDRAREEHNRNATGILNRIAGASSRDMGDELKVRLWDQYVDLIREWDAATPEWVR